LNQMGFNVTLLQAQSSSVMSSLKPQRFAHFSDLNQKMKTLLSEEKFTHVIHLAAVSDYSIQDIERQGKKFLPADHGKISSDSETLTLHLKRNPKIVSQLKTYSANKSLKVIAFKLTSQASAAEREQAVQKLFTQGGADYVVHNDQAEITETNHPFTLYSPHSSGAGGAAVNSNSVTNGSFAIACKDLPRLAHELVQIILTKDAL